MRAQVGASWPVIIGKVGIVCAPVLNNSTLNVKLANGRAVGLNTPGALLNFTGSPCPTYTGDGCIGLNVNNTTTGGGAFSLFATVEPWKG